MDPMWFYDEAEQFDDLREFREYAQYLEAQHLEVRTALCEAERALRREAGNQVLQARVDELKKQQAELEKRIPWVSSEAPLEILLWGVPHG